MTTSVLTSAHAIALSAAADGTLPDWLHLLPTTPFRGRDGRGPYQGDLAAVAAATSLPIPIDEAHATDMPWMGSPRAVGWIEELQVRDDGLWGRVSWNDAGAALVIGKAYRFLSPVFQHDQALNLIQLERAGLVNNPNLLLTALNSREQPDLTGTTPNPPPPKDPPAITAAMSANIEALRTLAGVGADADLTAVVTALQSKNAQAVDLASQVTALQSQVTALQAQQGNRAAAEAVDAAITAGRATPAERAVLISTHEKLGAEAFTALMAARTPLQLSGSATPSGSPPPDEQLDDAKVATHARKLMDGDSSLSFAAAVRQAETELTTKGAAA